MKSFNIKLDFGGAASITKAADKSGESVYMLKFSRDKKTYLLSEKDMINLTIRLIRIKNQKIDSVDTIGT